jgi:MarR family transcriptional regulator, lower aerobic nicotinate degradation pathway regulator
MCAGDHPASGRTNAKDTWPSSNARMKKSKAPVDLQTLPGYNIRRLQQIAVALFLQEVAPAGITPVQFAALQAVANAPGLDQRTLAHTIGFDTSTIAGVIDRLEARGLMQRSASPQDKRVRLLHLSGEGERVLALAVPLMLQAQQRILAPLKAAERKEFLRLLAVLVGENNEESRAPSAVPGGAASSR